MCIPRPFIVSIVDAGADPGEMDEAAEGIEWYLMDGLFAGGTPAVFSILRAIYDIHIA